MTLEKLDNALDRYINALDTLTVCTAVTCFLAGVTLAAVTIRVQAPEVWGLLAVVTLVSWWVRVQAKFVVQTRRRFFHTALVGWWVQQQEQK